MFICHINYMEENNYNKIAQYYNIDKNNVLDVSQIEIPLHAFILLIAKIIKPPENQEAS